MNRISLVLHAVAGWAICGTTIGIGRTFLAMGTTLAVHGVVAPIAFGALTRHYCAHHAQPAPSVIAATFIAIVIGLDALLVAPVFEPSYAMFRSMGGTWIPFLLIVISTYGVARHRTTSHVGV